jgi:signal transduction histidine kinase
VTERRDTVKKRRSTVPPVPVPDGAPEAIDDRGETRRTLERILSRLEPDGPPPPSSLSVLAHRVERLLEGRTAELEERADSLEKESTELRSLTENLDRVVRQRTKALAESEATLRQKNTELDRLNRVKTEFIAIAAHELRTPMTSVVGYLDLFVERTPADLPPDFRRQLSALRRNAHRLRRLIEDMLDVSHLETGRVKLRRAPCSLGDIVNAVVDEMRPLAAQKQQAVKVEVADIREIDADSDKIHQVVANLVQNSLRYTPAGGEVRIIVDSAPAMGSPTHARLKVWDNGIGIPPALRDRIFEPFSDLHASKYHASGPGSAGLGLHIAKALVELHGGHIRVDSEEGSYSEFTVTLPLA